MFMKTKTLLLTLGLGAIAMSASAQKRVERVVMPTPDSVVVVEERSPARLNLGDIVGIENYDKLPDNALLPITREEAEEIIAKLIVASRAPAQEQINKAKVLNDFKIETLKKRLLEEALRRSYADEYERRISRLENLILLLLGKGELDPNTILSLLGKQGATTPMATLTPATTTNALIDPKAADTHVALTPGAKAASMEHFLSQVFFAFDSSKLTPDAKKVLDNAAAWIKINNMGITLRGYASPEGNMKYNNKLSGRRVKACADYLESKGVSRSLLKVIPSGIDSMKITTDIYPDARRVDIRPDYKEEGK